MITKTLVTDLDMSNAGAYVADPFIVQNAGLYYLFFEALRSAGNTFLCCATSPDLATWTYGNQVQINGVAAFGHSYPFVFNVGGNWWMLRPTDPDTPTTKITLLRPTFFPNQWITVKDIVTDAADDFGDATIFQYGDNWYVTVGATGNNCRMFTCPYLTGTWTEHPSSPILTGLDTYRPGGRPIIRPGVGVDIMQQDDNPTYGNAVRVFRLSNLSPTTCTVTELATSPLIAASGSGWNATGMHTLDRINANYTIVDGVDASGIYTIGIYEDVP